jgi:hypothetical protein
MGRSFRGFAAALGLVVMVVLPAGEAVGRVRSVWPGAFRLSMNPGAADWYLQTDGYIQNEAVSGLTAAPVFFAPLKLPVGSRMTAVKVSGIALGGDIQVYLGRRKIGANEEGLLFDTLTADAVGDWRFEALSFLGGADRKIRPGYKYFIAVTVNRGTKFGGLQVSYH